MYKISYFSFFIISSLVISMDITSQLNYFQTVVGQNQIPEDEREIFITEIISHTKNIKHKTDESLKDLSLSLNLTIDAFIKKYDQIIDKESAQIFAQQATELIIQDDQKLQQYWDKHRHK